MQKTRKRKTKKRKTKTKKQRGGMFKQLVSGPIEHFTNSIFSIPIGRSDYQSKTSSISAENNNQLQATSEYNIDWKTCIEEWISIYNVAVDINKKYLQKLGQGEIDKCQFEKSCNYYSSDEYNKEEVCGLYQRGNNRVCVLRKRIKQWNQLKQHASKDKSILYDVIDIKEIKKERKNRIDHYYYYKYLSKLTNNILIMFPVGTVSIVQYLWNRQDFFDTQWHDKINEFIDELLDNIINSHTNNNQKYIFCGHSMGSILAFYAAYRMKEKNSVFFNKHCIVIVSGHFKWIDPDVFNSFTNLQNVKAYVYGEIYPQHTNNILLDSFYNKPDSDDKQYSPSIYLIKNGNQFIETTDISKYTIQYGKFKDEELIDPLHKWEYYYDAFEYLNTSRGRKTELINAIIEEREEDVKLLLDDRSIINMERKLRNIDLEKALEYAKNESIKELVEEYKRQLN